MHIKGFRFYATVCALICFVVVGVYVIQASAVPLSDRQIRIDNPLPSAVTNHHFQFTIDSISSVGSIKFEYCSNSPIEGVVCTAPTGFDASSAVLSSQTGETGFAIHANSTSNMIILTRVPAPTFQGPVTYVFNTIISPSANGTTFVRVATYASDDATGSYLDNGAVAFSTNNGFGADAYVPPFLRFCSGITVSLDCTQSNGLLADLGELRPNGPSTATSQLAAFTNGEGYAIAVLGFTMTSGNNVIPALTTPTTSTTGTGQFGFNLRANSAPGVGHEPVGVGTGVAQAGYNTPNQFKFASGDVIAASALPSESNVFTISYLVNVPDDQRPGTYNSTLTYVCTTQF